MNPENYNTRWLISRVQTHTDQFGKCTNMDLRKLAVRVLILVSSGTSSTCTCSFCVSFEIRSLGGLFGLGGGASTSDIFRTGSTNYITAN